HLVAAAGAGDAARADLALLRDEPAQRGDVLVVDLLDLVAAVLAGLAPPAPEPALLVAPAWRLAAPPGLGHQRLSRKTGRGSAWVGAWLKSLSVARTECRRRPRRRSALVGSPPGLSGSRHRSKLRCPPDDLRTARQRRRRRASRGTAPSRQ